MKNHNNHSCSPLKDFQKEYTEMGAYHLNAKGFKKWWLTDNYKMLASFTQNNETILDVACGEGCFAAFVSPQNRLFGIDLSEAALKLIPDQYRSRYEKLYRGNMLDLDRFFGISDAIETVICSLSLMYLFFDDVTLFLNKINKLLLPGGKFVFSYPNVFAGVRSANPEAAELTWAELNHVLQTTGFKVENRQGISGFLPNDLLQQSENETDNKIFERYLREKEKIRENPDYSYHYVVNCKKKEGNNTNG